MGKPENKVEESVKRHAEQRGGVSYKFTSPGCLGVPDRINLYPITDPVHREIVAQYIKFIECKAPGKKARRAQEYEIKRIRDLGFPVSLQNEKV